MKWIALVAALLMTSPDPVSTQDAPNFIVECYHHCDHQRAVCNNRVPPWWYDYSHYDNYGHCQVLYRECLAACNQHRIFPDDGPTVDPEAP